MANIFTRKPNIFKRYLLYFQGVTVQICIISFVHFTDWAEKGKPDSAIDPSNKGKDLVHFHFKEAAA